MIVDASAIVALSVPEPGWEELASRVDAAPSASTHTISIYEAALAIRRIKGSTMADASVAIDEFLRRSEIGLVVIGPAEAAAALDAFDRFGRGRHPAKLNMGDCFSYACAKVRGLPLLYKGDDFALTDLA